MDLLAKALLRGGGPDFRAIAEQVPVDQLNAPCKKLKDEAPLIFAIQNQDTDAVLALAHMPEVELTVTSEEGTPALHVAIETGSFPLCEVLCRAFMFQGYMPSEWETYILAGKQEDPRILQLLFDGRDPKNSTFVHPLNGRTLLHELVLEGATGGAIEVCLRYNICNVNEVDPDTGDTPLVAAVRRKHNHLLTTLIEGGADVCFEDEKTGFTALHVAVLLGASQKVQELLKDASEIRNKLGQKPQDLRAQRLQELEMQEKAKEQAKIAKSKARRDKRHEEQEATYDASEIAEFLKKYDITDASVKEKLCRRYESVDQLLEEAVPNKLRKLLNKAETDQLMEALDKEDAERQQRALEDAAEQSGDRQWTAMELLCWRILVIAAPFVVLATLYFGIEGDRAAVTSSGTRSSTTGSSGSPSTAKRKTGAAASAAAGSRTGERGRGTTGGRKHGRRSSSHYDADVNADEL
ncbi:unnamed protein product [Amoebophrya sp. A120]|nr:unnamed protein product [Amoebophrya sp. A120]|eukprot:GSA120T00024017001.1